MSIPTGLPGWSPGSARVSASPEPLTYHHDRPLPVTGGGRTVPLQRTVTSWPPPSPARSPLMTAPDVDLAPVPLQAVPAEPGTIGTDPAAATAGA